MNVKEGLVKYFTNLLSIITVVLVAGLVWQAWENHKRKEKELLLLEERYGRLVDTKAPYEQISGLVAQLSTAYKDQLELSKELALAWREIALEMGERVKSKTETVVGVESKSQEQPKSDYTFLTPDGKQEYSINELRINGYDSPPIGYVLVKNDGSVHKQNYKFEIRVENLQIKDDTTGKIRVVARAFLVPLEDGLAEEKRTDFVKWKDKKYPLPIIGGETVVDPKEPLVPSNKIPGFIWGTNNINAGFGLFGRSNRVFSKFTIDTNFAGYGVSKQDLDWKLLQAGVNFSDVDGFGFHLLPFSYRPLKNVFTNTYIGPGGYMNVDNEFGYFLGLNIGF